MKKRLNKRGQDLSIGTLILIVLGIVVLVFLILGFTMGWDNLLAKFNIFGGGGASISDVALRCNNDVSTNNRFSYCQKFEKLRNENKKIEYANCEDSLVKANVEGTLECEKIPSFQVDFVELESPNPLTDLMPAEMKCLELIKSKKGDNKAMKKICDEAIVNHLTCKDYQKVKTVCDAIPAS